MREILFRGKRLDNGEWVYGAYHKHDTVKVCIAGDDPKTKHIIIADGFCDWGFEPPLMCYYVDPDTVGQFTGLRDKNGKRIFEGDIVQYYGTYALEVYMENGHTKIRWFDTVTNSKCTELFFGYDEDAYGDYLVIGNKWDNPELLEGEG